MKFSSIFFLPVSFKTLRYMVLSVVFKTAQQNCGSKLLKYSQVKIESVEPSVLYSIRHSFSIINVSESDSLLIVLFYSNVSLTLP